jgi:Stress responsive A/B Barrel Domain
MGTTTGSSSGLRTGDVIQHIVLLRWKPDTTDEQIDAAFGQAQELVDGIASVNRITLGRNRGAADHGFTHAFIVTLSNDAGLTAYLNDPLRGWYLSEVINPLVDARVEIDVPEDASHERAQRSSLNWDWGTTRVSASAAAAALRWEDTQAAL